MKKLILQFPASLLLLFVLPAAAQPRVKDARSTDFSDTRIRSILKAAAFDVTEDPTANPTVFAFQVDGHPVTLRTQVDGLRLSACFESGVNPFKANQWNREHFSTGAYLDEKGCGALRADVRFGGGATNQMIGDFIREFCTDVVVFSRFLSYPPAGPDPPPASPAALLGTMAWSQPDPDAKRTPPLPPPQGSIPGLLKIASQVSLKYDPKQWSLAEPEADGLFRFSHASGAVHAVVIPESATVPLDSVQDIVLANAQFADPHAQMIFRNRIWNKGLPYWFLKFEATVQKIPMVYWGHFYAGEGATVQVVTYTEKSRLPEYEQTFTDFLSGLTLTK